MDESPSADTEVIMGVGDFPVELARMNWGALLAGPAWALFHGAWNWIGIWVALSIGSYAVLAATGDWAVARTFAGSVSLALLMKALFWGVMVTFGLRANRLAWEFARRRAQNPVAKPIPIGAYLEMQTRWIYIGLVLYAYGVWSTLNTLDSARFEGAVGRYDVGFEMLLLVVTVWIFRRHSDSTTSAS